MAQRNLITAPSTIKNVKQATTEEAVSGIAEIAIGVVDESMKAKTLEKLSAFNSELSSLDVKYQQENLSDPSNAIKRSKYTNDVKTLQYRYREEVPPLYRKQFNEQSNKVINSNKSNIDSWVVKQSKLNTKDSINAAISNDISMATSFGREFANSSSVEGLHHFQNNFNNMREGLVEIMGESAADEAMGDYKDDYIKSFLSGVADVNPSAALELMEEGAVISSFSNGQQYVSTKRRFSNKVDNIERMKAKQAKLDDLTAANKLKEIATGMDYASLQTYFEKNSVSNAARGFYESVAGLGKRKGKLSGRETIKVKADFYKNMFKLNQKETLATDDIEMLQNSMYVGMSKGVFTKVEGFGIINQYLEPLVERKREALSDFEAGEFNFFRDNLGFPELEKVINSVSGADLYGDKPTSQQINAVNNIKSNMYDAYLNSLESQAKKLNVNVMDIIDMSYDEQGAIYKEALNSTIQFSNFRNHPVIASQENPPHAVIQPMPDIPKELQFDSVEAAEKYTNENNLSDGTKVMINGSIATWSN